MDHEPDGEGRCDRGPKSDFSRHLGKSGGVSGKIRGPRPIGRSGFLHLADYSTPKADDPGNDRPGSAIETSDPFFNGRDSGGKDLSSLSPLEEHRRELSQILSPNRPTMVSLGDYQFMLDSIFL